MAERRMFHTGVVESDLFQQMPLEAQALYLHICMHADDDGFVNNSRQLARMCGAEETHLTVLAENGFLLPFEDVAVVRHWRMANSLKSDRIRPLRYPEIAKKIYIQENKIYTTSKKAGSTSLFRLRRNTLDSIWNPRREENKEKEKNKKESIAEEAVDAAFQAANERTKLQFLNGILGKGVVFLSELQIDDLLEQLGLDGFDYYVEKLADYIQKNGVKVKNHYATILKWWNEDKGVK